MQTRNKIQVDKVVGIPLVFLFNLLARFLGAILHINHSLPGKPTRIAVCKFMGMGSIIQSMPLVTTLRKNFPNASIIYISTEKNRKLLELLSQTDEIETIDDSNIFRLFFSMTRLLFRLWRKRVSIYIDLETYSYFSTLVATMSCSRNRLGFYRQDAGVRLGVYTHMMYFNIKSPISEAYLQMARLAGCREIVNEFPQISIEGSIKKSLRDKLKNISERQLIVMNPNASDLRIERRWNSGSYAGVISSLAEKYTQSVFVLTGSASESAWVTEVESKISPEIKNRVLNMAAKISLTELFAVIQQAQLVITNDSGPMHIAYAMQKPVVALFGPCSPQQYGVNPNGIVIYKNIYCSPCVHDFIIPPCKGNNQCMKLIAVNEVVNACRHLLDGNSPASFAGPLSSIIYSAPDSSSLGIVTRN